MMKHRVRMFRSNRQEKRKGKRNSGDDNVFSHSEQDKNKRKKPTNNVVIRGRRLSFPRKITAFHTLVSQQEGLEREKEVISSL